MLRRTAANGTAVAAILALAWGAVNTPVFHATDLTVTGHGRLTAAQVLRIGGVDAKTNVIRLSASTVESRLESSPWIADASVTRVLPDTVRIAVRERHPVAALRVPGRWATLAADGTVLELTPARPELPLVEGVERRGSLQVGALVSQARTALAVVDRLSVRWRVERIRAGHDVEARLRSGIRIRYGDAGRWREKNAALRALLAWAAEQGSSPALVDVRVPKAPTLRLASGAIAP